MAKPELRDHRKFLKLKRLLGEPTPHVLGYLDCLWHRGYQTGDPVIGDALDVEAAAEFPGEPGEFAKAAHEAGFLDQDGAGLFSIHNLYKHAPTYAKKRMHRKGTAPARTEKPQNRVRADTDGNQVCPRGQKKGKKSPARHTEPRTKNQEPRSENREPRTESQEQASIAASPPPAEPAAPVVLEPPKGRTRSPRDDVFDALVEVTGLDPKTGSNGSNLGKVVSTLIEGGYSPVEVREFARDFWKHCDYAARDGRARPTVNEVAKYIGLLRAAPPPLQRAPPAHAPTKGDLTKTIGDNGMEFIRLTTPGKL